MSCLVGDEGHLVSKKFGGATHLDEKGRKRTRQVLKRKPRREEKLTNNHERAEASERALIDRRDERMGKKTDRERYVEGSVDQARDERVRRKRI